MATPSDQNTHLALNWRHVGAFLGLTFGLTWLLNLAIDLHGGLRNPGIVPTLQLQMLLPAFSAIILGLLFFTESPIYHSRPVGPGRWFYYYFLALTAIYAIGALAGWLTPAPGTMPPVFAVIPFLMTVLGLVLLVVLRLTAGREVMARVWLSFGDWRFWLLFGLGFVAYYILQAALNAVSGLGGARLVHLPAPPGTNPMIILLAGVVQAVLLAPFVAIPLGFGEEYGWRGYLQSELFKLGRVRGALLVGVIWGVWHWPLILMGYDYPGHPLLGVVLMTLNTTGIAVVLGYAVLRSGSVLLAAYLHALNNQVTTFIFAVGFRPFDTAFSFGIGIYEIATLAIVVFFILRDPIWRGKGSNLS